VIAAAALSPRSCPMSRLALAGRAAPSAVAIHPISSRRKTYRPIHERSEQPGLVPRSLRLGCAGSKWRRPEFDESRQGWRPAKTEALGCQPHREGLGISRIASHSGSISGPRVSRRAPGQYRNIGTEANLSLPTRSTFSGAGRPSPSASGAGSAGSPPKKRRRAEGH
jgi:hypothetical protein